METEFRMGAKYVYLVSCEPPHESLEICQSSLNNFCFDKNVTIEASFIPKELFVTGLPRYQNPAMRNFLKKHAHTNL